MKKIVITMLDKPGKSVIGSVLARAESMKDYGYISEIPDVSADTSKGGFGKLVINCNDVDASAWIGFWQGVVFCSNNKEITCGNAI
jgi:hypothetical protein